MIDTEKINAIKQLLEEYGIELKEDTIADILEEISYIRSVGVPITDLIEVGYKLSKIIYEE